MNTWPDGAKLKKGHQAGDKTYKVHIDGHSLLDFLTKKGVKSPREGFIYFSDDGDQAMEKMEAALSRD